MRDRRHGIGRTQSLFLRARHSRGRPADCGWTRQGSTCRPSRDHSGSTLSLVKIVALQLQATLPRPVGNFRGEGSYDETRDSLQGGFCNADSLVLILVAAETL